MFDNTVLNSSLVRTCRRKGASAVGTLVFLSLPLLHSLLYSPQQAHAEEQIMHELHIMSLQELMEVEIQTASRRPTPLKQVAENVVIVTAEEIMAMNAYSVMEVLHNVPAFMTGIHWNYGGTGSLSVHGSDSYQVQILLDSIRINAVDEKFPATEGIPVQIIDRIEIIKGPATSSWDSAAFGVVNIITKEAGNEQNPSRLIHASYGSDQTGDYRLEFTGGAKKVNYYLYGGFQESDGWLEERSYENESFFAKVGSGFSADGSWTVSAGSNNPDAKYLNDPVFDLASNFIRDQFFIQGVINRSVGKNLKVDIAAHYLQHDAEIPRWSLGQGINGPNAEFLWAFLADRDTYGGSVKFILEKENHTMLLGLEYEDARLNRMTQFGSWFQSFGLPPGAEALVTAESAAIFFNDTITWGNLTLIPGIRYDHLTYSEDFNFSFFNPSLGLTYAVTDETIFRATMSRGFNSPTIDSLDPIPPFPGSPGLEPEEIRAIQGGIESTVFNKIYLKADAFHYRVYDRWQDIGGVRENMGTDKRTGIDITVATSPVENFDTMLGYSFVRTDAFALEETEDQYSFNAKFSYKSQVAGNFLLQGNYKWWGDIESPDFRNGEFGDIIWAFHYNKDILSLDNAKLNLFFSVRNLFSGAQYWDESFENPDRWYQGGLKLFF